MTVGIDYAALITHIRETTAPTFLYVSYCLSPEVITNLASNPALPAAFLAPGGCDYDSNVVSNAGGLRQWITESFVVAAVFANTGDLLAQDSMNQIPTFREALRKSLVNYHPLPFSRTVKPIVALKDYLYMMQAGSRTIWNFEYSLSYQIDNTDCYNTQTATVTIKPIISKAN